jgi:hypothetical protein
MEITDRDTKYIDNPYKYSNGESVGIAVKIKKD